MFSTTASFVIFDTTTGFESFRKTIPSNRGGKVAQVSCEDVVRLRNFGKKFRKFQKNLSYFSTSNPILLKIQKKQNQATFPALP